MSQRGYIGIQEVLSRAQPLADWQLKYKPELKTLRMGRADYDLIARWPAAGAMQADPIIYYPDGKMTWRGLELKFDNRPMRYKKPVEYKPAKQARAQA
jgi:hypothetical protein